jgi:hypothetical protein
MRSRSRLVRAALRESSSGDGEIEISAVDLHAICCLNSDGARRQKPGRAGQTRGDDDLIELALEVHIGNLPKVTDQG